jgi:hypothetical protein
MFISFSYSEIPVMDVRWGTKSQNSVSSLNEQDLFLGALKKRVELPSDMTYLSGKSQTIRMSRDWSGLYTTEYALLLSGG